MHDTTTQPAIKLEHEKTCLQVVAGLICCYIMTYKPLGHRAGIATITLITRQ